MSEGRIQLIKAHTYNQASRFCGCGQQFDWDGWARHVDGLITKYHNDLTVIRRHKDGSDVR